ncbi:MAG: hypothetical protein LDL31_05290, partial [Prosthecobacter sp.]|nr:hypothetical protein [Prosthecobacter sp.]
AFDEAGADLGTAAGRDALTRFLCLNGPAFYGFPASRQTFQMQRGSCQMAPLETPAGPVTPLPLGLGLELTWRLGR